MDPKKLHQQFPWITKEGYFDPGKFPIDSALKQALSNDDQEFRSGLNLLSSMYSCGPTTHRAVFSDNASRWFCRLEPTTHRVVPRW